MNIDFSLLMPLPGNMDSKGGILKSEKVDKPEQVLRVLRALYQISFCFNYSVHVEVEPDLVALVTVFANKLENEPENLAHNFEM